MIAFLSKYSLLAKFFNDLNKFNKLKTQKEKQKRNVHKALELHNEFLETYFNEYYGLSNAERKKIKV